MTDILTPTTLDRVSLYFGDSSDVLPLLEPEQFTACVCDPPYHLTQKSRKGSPRNNDPETSFGRTRLGPGGFMGKTWDGGDVAFRPEFWAEVIRVLKPGAMLLAFGGTRTFHRLTCAIEDAGFEIRDCLMWLYGSGFPKSHDISKAIDKVARGVPHGGSDPTSPNHGKYKGGCSADNVKGQGFGAGPGQFMREQGVTVKRELVEAAQTWDGYGTALKPAWEPIVLAMKPLDGTFAENAMKYGVAGINVDGGRVDGPNPSGRWPANLILQHHPDCPVGMLDRQSGERPGCKSSSGASRFYYCAKASKRDRTCDDRVENKHPTVKPRSLMEYLCRLVTPPGGGIILDPFMGSGSTGLGALLTGNRFVGIEFESDSFETARRRIKTMPRRT